MRLRIAVIALNLAALAGAQQAPTIRVPVRLVSLPTLVFSKENRLMSGLQKTDFRVFDNGRLQTVTLDTSSTPVSVALAVQVNLDVRQYLPGIAKTGSIVDALLAGESGESAVITYSGEITVAKPFDTGDVQATLRTISPSGTQARMIDAGFRAISLLTKRPALRSRVLVFIGQPMDSGSESSLASLSDLAARENVTVFALTLPVFGKAFVSDTFSLQGASAHEKGGFKAGVDLGKLIAVLNRTSVAEKAADPYSVLTSATGGTQFHFRKQRQLEDAMATLGLELRSAYRLSFYPNSPETGHHTVKLELDVPGAKAYARPGYWLNEN
jgi:VWFA-related protein